MSLVAGTGPSESSYRWPRALYVPVASGVLVLLMAHWLAPRAQFRPGAALEKTAIPSPQSRSSSEPPTLGVLYLGDSQTVVVRDAGAEDRASPAWLEESLAQQAPGLHARVKAAGLGGMTTTEMLVALVASREQQPQSTNVVVLAVLPDEFRNLGVRKEVAQRARPPHVNAALRRLLDEHPDLDAIRSQLLPILATDEANPAQPESAQPLATPAERFESAVERAADHLPVFADRGRLSEALVYVYIRWRNRLLHVTSASRRPVFSGAYEANVEALQLALEYAREKGIVAVVYLGPQRALRPGPFLDADLARLDRDTERLSANSGAFLADYRRLVPEPLWTTYYTGNPEGLDGQPDFLHMRNGGHQLVAAELAKALIQQLAGREEGRRR